MQDHLKYLVVDDITEWANLLNEAVEEYFVDEKRFARARVRGKTAYAASQADNLIADGGWDLVLLDMNLGEGSARKGAQERISGLDLLGDIARGNRAYFVIIVTGAVTDPELERVYGRDTAALLRFGAMNEAVKKMPASRIRILHKPEAQSVGAAVEMLRSQLHSALDQYCSVSLERNVFRTLPGEPDLLEICYNGGPRLTIAFEAPFRTLQSALAQPNRMLKVTELIQKLANSSGQGGAVTLPEGDFPERTKRITQDDYSGHQDDDVSAQDGLDWREMDGFGVATTISSPVDSNAGAIPVETLILGLLDTIKMQDSIPDYLRGLVNMGIDECGLLSIPKIAAEWAHKGGEARKEFGENASEKLMEAVRAIAPHLKEIKDRWLQSKTGGSGAKPKTGKANVRITLRQDTDEMVLARQHWKRFQNKIRKRPSLAEFHKHMTQWVDRSPTARGHLYYRPPGGGEFYPFWLTE